MKICVLGLWHLGIVTAACLASVGHKVIGLDFQIETIENLQKGIPPIFEPGLENLLSQGLTKGNLHFTANIYDATKQSDIVWVTYDTPVDEDDRADVEFVLKNIIKVFPFLEKATTILISSQLPVGTTRKLEENYKTNFPDKPISFSYSPENLRLGKAINVFTNPDRIIVGVRSQADKEKLTSLLAPFTENIVWMSVESAEMTKHALNAFLATSVTFINEIATICEKVGADAKEVELGLKSESRIGPKAYLAPGNAFAGGTLARDIAFLRELGLQCNSPTHLLSAILTSNDRHKQWAQHKLQDLFGDLREQTIAIWGLTYKPGTDTLRRSSAIELCKWLVLQGAKVQAHDPAIKILPPEFASRILLCPTPDSALAGAVALVITTEWPDYLKLPPDILLTKMRLPNVIDINRFLVSTLGSDARIRYITVGKPLI
jgi:UDPglucose 6-dehydrogenase